MDRISKYSIFILTPNACIVDEVARLFFGHVVKYFRLPRDIVSNRDVQFIGRFWLICSNSWVRS